MIVRSLADIEDTERDVGAQTWRSRRLVLAREKVGFSLHDTVIQGGTETSMWYAHHVEAVYCIEGEGEVVNDENGEAYDVSPGTVYLLDGHEHHTVRARTDLRLVCVFNPPVTGREVHDENGVYPLLRDADDDSTTEAKEVSA